VSYRARNYFETPGPVAYPDWSVAPVPGWGMRPEMAGPSRVGVAALGYDLVIKTPIGTQKIHVPIEQMAKDAAEMAVDAVWPPVKKKLDQALPELLKKGLDVALPAAQKAILTELWPKMQPKLRGEVDYAIGRAKTIALFATLGLSGAVVAAALILRSKRSAA